MKRKLLNTKSYRKYSKKKNVNGRRTTVIDTRLYMQMASKQNVTNLIGKHPPEKDGKIKGIHKL